MVRAFSGVTLDHDTVRSRKKLSCSKTVELQHLDTFRCPQTSVHHHPPPDRQRGAPTEGEGDAPASSERADRIGFTEVI